MPRTLFVIFDDPCYILAFSPPSRKSIDMTLVKLSLCSALALCCTACPNFTSLQTARTTPQGKTEMTFATGVGRLVEEEDASFAGEDDDIPFPKALPLLEIRARHGLESDLDIGFRLSPGTMVGADIKKTLLDEGGVALAIGADLGGIYFGNGGYVELGVPLYISVHPADGLALYLSPRYVARFGYNENNDIDPETTYTYHFAGVAAGLKAGTRYGFVGEVNAFTNFPRSTAYDAPDEGDWIYQLVLGGFVAF